MTQNVAIKKLAAVGVSIAMIAAVGGCSTQQTKSSSEGKTDTLKLLWVQPNFTQNFNTFSPSSKKAPYISLFYESLVRIDHTDSNKVKPWLAKSFDYSDGGKTLTFKLRNDVKFADGKQFTSQDVKYSLELPKKTDGLGTAPPPDLKSVTTPDKYTAVVHYSKPQLHDLANYDSRSIVPEHIWKKHNPKKWTNKKPIGTGAFTLESFSPQSIKLTTRDDYWHGEFDGVSHVNIKAAGSEGTAQQMLLKNKASWVPMDWKNYKKEFVEQDSKHHLYRTYPQGGSEGIVFNAKKAPTDNVHVRRALYAALDPKKMLKLFEDGQTPANPTGLDGDLWKDFMPANLRDARHQQDIEKARSELKASGYKVKGGKLTQGGKSYPLSLGIVSSYENWAAWAPGLRSQWKEALGLNVSIKKNPVDQYGEYQGNGDFVMEFGALTQADDIWANFHTQLSGDYLKPLGTRTDGNYGRFESAKVDKQLEKMARTRDQKKLKASAAAIERIVIDEVPYGPLASRMNILVANSRDWTGWPDSDQAGYVPYPTMAPDTTLTIQNLEPNTGS